MHYNHADTRELQHLEGCVQALKEQRLGRLRGL